jgi:hypothetical protein
MKIRMWFKFGAAVRGINAMHRTCRVSDLSAFRNIATMCH